MPAARLPMPQPQEPPGTFLFDAETIKSLTNEEEKHGIYTPQRLDELTRRNIIELLAEQRPVHFIARVCRVHTETVTGVADFFATEIANLRALLARKLRRIIVGQADRLEKYPEGLPIAQVPLAIKLLGEFAELLDGKATSRVEMVERVDVFTDFQAFLARLEMETKNGTVETGDAGGKKALIAGAAADPGAGRESGLVLDCESSVSEAIPQAKPNEVTGCVTGSAVETNPPGPPAGPPGGGSPAAAARGRATDNSSQNFWPKAFMEEPIE